MAPRARGLSKSVHSADQATFCRLLQQARRKAGLTQQDVADRLGKPQSFIAKIEGDERRIDVVEFLALMRALGGDAARFIRALQRALELRH